MNDKFRVIFSHGKESGPNGSKITHLAEIARRRGCTPQSIDYTRTTDPDERVAILLEEVEANNGPLILVGSSMGGYVSVVASRVLHPKGLFLMAPALYLPGYEVNEPLPLTDRVEIVHGWGDDIVPPENSIRFARQHNSTLHLLDGNHSLDGRVEMIGEWFELFLKMVTSPL